MILRSIALATALLCAGGGNAALIANWTLVKQPPLSTFNAPENALPYPWVAYQLRLTTTIPGQIIAAVDVRFTGARLHQRWSDNDFDGITDPSINSTPSNGRGDSHLTAPASAPFALYEEKNSKAGSPLPSVPGFLEYGLGDLKGAWGIPNPTTSANVAYIVYRADEWAQINVRIEAASPAGDNLGLISGPAPQPPPIPEPVSIALLVPAAIAACRCRSRPDQKAPSGDST